MPVTIPDVPIVAYAALPLIQLPPAVASDKVVLKPTQTFAVPVILAGSGFTVMIVVAIQPVGKV